MKRFQQVSVWLQIMVATVLILIKDEFELLLRGSTIEDYYLFPFLVVGAVGMYFADHLADVIISNFRMLRRVLAGNDDIEGNWVNVVVDSDNPKQVKFIEFCVIGFRDNRYLVSGNTWAPEGDYAGEFACGASIYSGKELAFTYRIGSASTSGYGIIKFIPHDGLPEEFYGYYSDEASVSRRSDVWGKRLRKSKSLNITERQQKALEFVEDYKTGRFLASPDIWRR